MTTLERLAKLAYERMISIQKPYLDMLIFEITWGTESQQLRDNWIAATRSVVEGMKEDTNPIWFGLWKEPENVWLGVLERILEEKP